MNVMLRIIESMPKRIVKDLKNRNDNTFKVVLAAYNEYCENENNGNGYLFNINDHDDLKCLVKNGLTASEIAKIYYDSQVTASPYFFCDENHGLEVVTSIESVRNILITMVYELCDFVLTYVSRVEEYQNLYEMYVTDTYIEYETAQSLRDKERLEEITNEIQANLP